MTTPDPRTDLAGYLGLTEEQARICRSSAEDGYTGIRGKVGARLIEQDQARDAEPDDGQHAMLDIDALGGPKMLRETMCVAQGAVLREGHAGAQLHADRIASIIDVCDQHRPLGPDGKHGTRQCTLTCGCIDKRLDVRTHRSPDVSAEPEPVEGPPGTVPAFLGWNVGEEDPHDHYPWTWMPLLPQDGGPVIGGISTPNGRRPDGSMHTFWGVASNVWEPIGHLICHVVNQWAHEQFGTPVPPAPLPPWKSPLADLPDLTEEQCCDAVRIAGEGPDSPVMWAQVGRALIAAGWTQGEEA